MTSTQPRFYEELADWWPLFSPAEHYAEEAEDLLPRLGAGSAAGHGTLLELGAGGGSLASHLKRHFQLTLTDLSPGMLAVSRTINPECEHLVGDMRSLRLNRRFDVVLIHDAIMYATTPADVQAALQTAAIHCRAGGHVAVLPDYVQETFAPGTDDGGHDASDGRGLRYLEWRWDPDPADHTYIVDYAFLLRDVGGAVTVVHDRHVEGLFPRADWLEWFRDAGLAASGSLDPWGRDIFIARPVETKSRISPGHSDARNDPPAVEQEKARAAVSSSQRFPDGQPSTPSLVTAFYERIWNSGDLSAVDDLLTVNFSFRGSLGAELAGRRPFAEYVRQVRAALADYRCEILDCVAEEHQAFARMKFSGRHVGVFRGYAPTGTVVSWLGAAMFRFDGGMIKQLWVLGDLAGLDEVLKANRAAGNHNDNSGR